MSDDATRRELERPRHERDALYKALSNWACSECGGSLSDPDWEVWESTCEMCVEARDALYTVRPASVTAEKDG